MRGWAAPDRSPIPDGGGGAYRSRMTQPGRAQPGRARALSGSTPSPRPAPRAPRRLDLTADARSVDEQRRRGRDAVGSPRSARRVQVPAVVWLVDELPKGPTGKIVKREIKPPVEA